MINAKSELFDGCIKTINLQIEILRNAGIEIHDKDNWEWVLKEIRYSMATDSVSFETIPEDEELKEAV